MKRAMTAMGLGTLAVMAVLGVFSVGSASAQTLFLFLWTGPLPGLLLFLNDNLQIFHPIGGASFEVFCEHFGGHGILSNGSAMWQSTGKITGKYSKCKATGGFTANISEVEYELNAQGSVAILKPIEISVLSLGCSIKVESSAEGQNTHLLELLFLNLPTDLLVHVAVSGIHATFSNEKACGITGLGLLHSDGTYTGLLLAWVDGGTLQWMG